MYVRTDQRTLFGGLKEGKLKPHIAGTYALERGTEAICLPIIRKVSSKIVITA